MHGDLGPVVIANPHHAAFRDGRTSSWLAEPDVGRPRIDVGRIPRTSINYDLPATSENYGVPRIGRTAASARDGGGHLVRERLKQKGHATLTEIEKIGGACDKQTGVLVEERIRGFHRPKHAPGGGSRTRKKKAEKAGKVQAGCFGSQTRNAAV